MNRIQILDCTLRDGGYINDWNFGKKTIKKILQKLSEAQIDIIECGFLSDVEYDSDKTIFSKIVQITTLLPISDKIQYVAMIALGEKEISYEKISECDLNSISGIRLTFHKHEIDRAFEYADKLMKKGYQVFMQPVGTCTYSDKELLKLVERINLIKPYAFYIVDTLGTITGLELMRMFQLIDNNLKAGIKIGFHSHNNLQLSFANAQELIQIFTKREIIIDASVLGMGRGAGNLCTELITQYVNAHITDRYRVTLLLEIVDNYLMRIKEKYPWGYTIPYYIAAVYKCHPNYATYLMNRQTLNVKDIEKIIISISETKRAMYDKEYIASLYQEYQEHFVDDRSTIQKLIKKWEGKSILLLAPGKALLEGKEIIKEYIDKYSPFIISVNFNSKLYKEDMIFISNLKRFENLDLEEIKEWKKELIITSNIAINETDKSYVVNYTNYLNADSMISDNAGLMLCQLLKICGVKKVALAGFDGFVADTSSNYFDKELVNNVEAEALEIKTKKIREQLRKLKNDMEILYVTSSHYEEKIEEEYY